MTLNTEAYTLGRQRDFFFQTGCPERNTLPKIGHFKDCFLLRISVSVKALTGRPALLGEE